MITRHPQWEPKSTDVTLAEIHTRAELESLAESMRFPSDYGGDWLPTFAPIIGRHRDSDLVDRVNWDSALEIMREWLDSDETDDTRVMHARHWAVGWVDTLRVRVTHDLAETDKYAQWSANDLADCRPTAAYLHALDEIIRPLAEYPILDEDAFSAAEWDDAVETWDDYIAPDASRLWDDETDRRDEIARQVSEAFYGYGISERIRADEIPDDADHYLPSLADAVDNGATDSYASDEWDWSELVSWSVEWALERFRERLADAVMARPVFADAARLTDETETETETDQEGNQ